MKPEFKSQSQAGQDIFAYQLIGEVGTFADIGANHPVEKSNTYALEQMGWRGVCVENDAHCLELLRGQRVAMVVAEDATNIRWANLLMLESFWSYLSLDVDEATLAVLRNLLPCLHPQCRFPVITLEHDAYRFGDARRDEMVRMLREHGYDVLCSDVCDQGLSFEIWAVDPLAVDMTKAEKFRRDKPTDWKEFFA